VCRVRQLLLCVDGVRVHAQSNFGMIFFVIILCHILRLKCIEFDFDWGSAPDPAGGAYTCSVPPDHLDLSGSISTSKKGGKGKGTEGKDVEMEGREEEGREGKV